MFQINLKYCDLKSLLSYNQGQTHLWDLGIQKKKGHLDDHTGVKPSGLNYHCLFISVFHELRISRRGSAAVIFLFQSLEELWLKK